MAKYRVQGPDGAVHVFEGPDNATPEQVTAAAAQQFGGGKPAAVPAAPQAAATPDDPGAMMSALIGAGWTTDRVLKGMQQLYLGAKSQFESPTSAGKTPSEVKLDELRDSANEDARLYKPLQEQHPIATAIGEAAPAMVVPVGGAAGVAGNVGRLAAAGAIPGALEYGTAGERAGRAAGGAAAGVAGGVVVPAIGRAVATAVPAIGRTARAITDPLSARGVDSIVGRTMNRAAGQDAAAVARRLAGAAEVVPGSVPTAAQVAENGGVAALERAIAQRNPAEFAQRGMDQSAARLQALRGIAGDDATRAAAVTSRQEASGPLYQQATRANYTMDPRLERLLQTPAMQQAMGRAETLAANNQRPFAFDVPNVDHLGSVGNQLRNASRQISGQGLQDLKMAMDEMLADPSTGFTGSAGNAVRALRGQLINWMEGANPAYRAARTTHAEMSRPINQMDIGQELIQRLEPALADHGALARETGNKFALALRNGEQTARTATGFRGSNMADTMTPDQMGALSGIGQDLARKANAQDLGRGVGSNTFQNFAMDNIAGQSGAPRVMGAAMNLPGVSKIARFLYSGPEERIQNRIGQVLLNPQEGAQLMLNNLPAAANPAVRDILFANPQRATQAIGGMTGLAAGNLFAQ